MAKRKVSASSKRRLLLAQRARLERSLGKVSAQLEACLSCSSDKLKSGLASIEKDGERERKALLNRLGISEAEAAELLSGKVRTGKKTSKKASKKAPAASAPGGGETSKVGKKTSKRKSKKTSKKKASKKG